MTTFIVQKRQDREYELCKAVATYLRLQYPNVVFHFDYAGISHTKAQAGKMKAIQGDRGFPDLIILEPSGEYHALLIEFKKDSSQLFNKKGTLKTDKHIQEQKAMQDKLNKASYLCYFCWSFEHAKIIIDSYLILGS